MTMTLEQRVAQLEAVIGDIMAPADLAVRPPEIADVVPGSTLREYPVIFRQQQLGAGTNDAVNWVMNHEGRIAALELAPSPQPSPTPPAPAPAPAPAPLPAGFDTAALVAEVTRQVRASLASPAGDTGPILLTANSDGSNTQTSIGLIAGASTGKRRESIVQPSADGGVRVTGNARLAPDRVATGTVARTSNDTLTFDSPATMAQVVLAWTTIVVNVGGLLYAYVPRRILSPTTVLIPWDEAGGIWTMRPFEIRGTVQSDPNRGSPRVALLDSAGNVIGASYRQPGNSKHVPWFQGEPSYIKDFHFLVYLGGYDTPQMGFGRNTDIGVNGAGRRLRIFTSENNRNDAFKPCVTFHDHAPGRGGAFQVHGTLLDDSGGNYVQKMIDATLAAKGI